MQKRTIQITGNMQQAAGRLKVDIDILKRINNISGLFLMGSRSEGDNYPSGESDIDCCVVVTQPITYGDLYGIVCKSISENARIELCPRTVSQLQIKNKFNFDLKYISRALYIRKTDVRNLIPKISLEDFTDIDVYSSLSSSLGFLLDGLHVHYTDHNNSRSTMILLEKSLRKLSLFLNLRSGVYPIQKGTRYAAMCSRYKNYGYWLTNLSHIRKDQYYKSIDISRSAIVLSHMISNELCSVSTSHNSDLNQIAGKIADKEHLDFMKSVLSIFFSIAHELRIENNFNNILELEKIRKLLINDYHSLISDDQFVPPAIINGDYHVFK